MFRTKKFSIFETFARLSVVGAPTSVTKNIERISAGTAVHRINDRKGIVSRDVGVDRTVESVVTTGRRRSVNSGREVKRLTLIGAARNVINVELGAISGLKRGEAVPPCGIWAVPLLTAARRSLMVSPRPPIVVVNGDLGQRGEGHESRAVGAGNTELGSAGSVEASLRLEEVQAGLGAALAE